MLWASPSPSQLLLKMLTSSRCNSSDELHHARHREILKILRQIKAIDQEPESSVLFPESQSSYKGKARRNSSTTRSTSTPTDVSSVSEDVYQEDLKVTRRERKKAKKASNGPMKGRLAIDIITNDDIDFVSEALHLAKHESKGAWEGTYIYNHGQSEVEKENKVVNEEDWVDTEDAKIPRHYSRSANLAVKPPLDMTPRQRKTMKKFYTPVQHSSFGGGSRKYSPRHPVSDAYDGLDPAIFFRLGVEIETPIKNTKERKELVAKLIAAIKEDMDVITREENETEMRAEGFWRWAGKTAFQNIMRTRDTLDWATGQKIGNQPPKREAIVEQEVEFDEENMASTPQAKTPITLEVVTINSGKEKKVLDTSPGAWQAVTKRARVTKVQKRTINYVKVLASTTAEEGGNDLNEMVRRHEQTIAGERTIGRSDISLPEPKDMKVVRKSGCMVISLK